MKKATVCHPGGEKTTIEIAGLQDIFQKGDSQQSATNHSNRTAFSKELQRISEVYDGHVLVLVLPMVDSAVNVYVVPVDPEESGAVEISAEKIRLTARRKFGIDISSLGPLHEESRPATDINEKSECE